MAMNCGWMRFLYRFSLLGCVFFTAVKSVNDCDVTPCPIETPYCTTAGCVPQCPEHSFANNTRCVLNCGERVADGNICKDVCPTERQYIQDNIVVVGGTFQRVHLCVESCDLRAFAYKNTCVNTCPAEAMFVVKKKCKPMCPVDLQFRLKKKTSTNNTYVECSKVCRGDKPVLKKQTCVSKCDDGEVVFEGSCVEECPEGFEYLQQSELLIIKDKECVKDCGDNYLFGRDCVHNCPADMLVAKNRYRPNECVKQCSDDQVANGSVCMDTIDCKHPNIVHDEKCLNICPEYTFYERNNDKGTCKSQWFNIILIPFAVLFIVCGTGFLYSFRFQPSFLIHAIVAGSKFGKSKPRQPIGVVLERGEGRSFGDDESFNINNLIV